MSVFWMNRLDKVFCKNCKFLNPLDNRMCTSPKTMYKTSDDWYEKGKMVYDLACVLNDSNGCIAYEEK